MNNLIDVVNSLAELLTNKTSKCDVMIKVTTNKTGFSCSDEDHYVQIKDIRIEETQVIIETKETIYL
jgi:hypothetical protein